MMRAIKEQIKSFVKVLTPFKRSNSDAAISTQLESANKTKPDEDVPKLTQSKSKEDVPNKSRKMSVLSDQADGNLTLIPKNLSKVVENQVKTKAENQTKTRGENQAKIKVENQGKARKTYGESDKKKYSKKMMVDKDAKPGFNIPHVNYKMEPLGNNALVVPGDILGVFHRDKHNNIYSTTYDAKVISTCNIEGSHRYFVHYVGWNTRYDEWVDHLRISCKREPHCHASKGRLDNNIEHSDETFAKKDHFVAQLDKFMDDRGTPLNQVPIINGKDVDLYKLFKIVNNLGGFNKVSKFKQWKIVATKIGHEPSIFIIKQVYQQYLYSFEDFYRNRGCTKLNHPRGVRSQNRFSPSVITDVDKALASPSTAERNKNQKQESKDKTESAKDNKTIKDPVINKKTAKNSKLDEKTSQKNNEDLKKGDKKKEDSNSRSKIAVKWNPDILEAKDNKTFVKVSTPLKKSKRIAASSTQLELELEKKYAKKMKVDKDAKPGLNIPHVNYKMEPLGNNALAVPGDILSVFYGDTQNNIYSTTIDAKVISTCVFEGAHRYLVHYVGRNSRNDEWVDHLRISCKRVPHCHASED